MVQSKRPTFAVRTCDAAREPINTTYFKNCTY